MPRLHVLGWCCAASLLGCSGVEEMPGPGSSGAATSSGGLASSGGANAGSSSGGSPGVSAGAAGLPGTSGSQSFSGNAAVGGAAGSAGSGNTGGATGGAGLGGSGGSAAGGGGTSGTGGTKIFDGTTLMGWTSKPEGMFKVMDGALVSTGKGRGTFATDKKYTHFRVLFSVHPGGTGGHAPTVLVFCNYPNADALGGIQFQPPNGGHWDYRPGKNNDGAKLFDKIGPPGPAVDGWTSCELIANSATGEAKMACGGKDVLHFKDPTAGQSMAAPFAIQTHNAGITDGYKDLSIEDNLMNDDYVTVK